MANQNKLHGKTKRRVNALERIKKLLTNKNHLPKRYLNEDGTYKVKGKDFEKARIKYTEELKKQIQILEKRIGNVQYESQESIL